MAALGLQVFLPRNVHGELQRPQVGVARFHAGFPIAQAGLHNRGQKLEIGWLGTVHDQIALLWPHHGEQGALRQFVRMLRLDAAGFQQIAARLRLQQIGATGLAFVELLGHTLQLLGQGVPLHLQQVDLVFGIPKIAVGLDQADQDFALSAFKLDLGIVGLQLPLLVARPGLAAVEGLAHRYTAVQAAIVQLVLRGCLP